MILVLAGTADGKDLAARLAASGFKVLASAATSYGGEVLQSLTGLAVRWGALDEAGFSKVIEEEDINGILDATHPFAFEVSRLARDAAGRFGIPYLRWEREAANVPYPHPLVFQVSSWEEAVLNLAGLNVQRVFLAVGVKPLEFFLQHPLLRSCQFVVRVLPLTQSLNTCLKLGLKPEQVVTFWGVASKELNEALLQHFAAQALVTKESGRQGGTEEKVSAALEIGIPVVVVRRQQELRTEVAKTWEQVKAWAMRLRPVDN